MVHPPGLVHGYRYSRSAAWPNPGAVSLKSRFGCIGGDRLPEEILTSEFNPIATVSHGPEP